MTGAKLSRPEMPAEETDATLHVSAHATSVLLVGPVPPALVDLLEDARVLLSRARSLEAAARCVSRERYDIVLVDYGTARGLETFGLRTPELRRVVLVPPAVSPPRIRGVEVLEWPATLDVIHELMKRRPTTTRRRIP